MIHNGQKIAGTLLLTGGIQCVLGIIVAEALYPGYNTSTQTISALGVGPSAIVFNSAIFITGILGLMSTYFIQRIFNKLHFTVLLAITHIGVIGVSLFTEAPTSMALHSFFSVVTYIFGGLSAIVSFIVQKSPLSLFSVCLGGVSLLAMGFLVAGQYLGLGLGGIERLVAYPLLLWIVAFGSHLIAYTG
jgi:hypothetical membrane protein